MDTASRPLLSVVSPVYGAAAIVPELVRRICGAMEPITRDFEIVLVEDGSPDASWEAIAIECRKDARVKGVRLSRNFGQHAAITAALAHASGAHVVVMDCDLQDDPAFIPALYAKAHEGFDVVFARRRERRFGFWKNLTAHAFYIIFRWLSGVDYDPRVGAYSIISRQVVDAFLRFGDYRRGYVLVLGWLGFRHGYVEVEHAERHSGESSYSVRDLLRHGLTIALSYSDKALHLSIYLGLFLSLLSFAVGAAAVIWYFASAVGQVAIGWTSLVVGIFLMGGLNLMSLGVVGLYVGRVFEQVKHRPIFLVRGTENLTSFPDRSGASTQEFAHLS
jgi:glycosyltransferase involved in cell wall biosynthesis